MKQKILLLLIFSSFLFSLNAQIHVQIGEDIDGEDIFDGSGGSIGTNANGSRIAIGAVLNSTNRGHVRVFDFDGENWVQVGNDIDSELIFGFFGASVVLNDEGNRLIASGIGFDKQSVTGFVRVFDFDGENWIQVGNDITSQSSEDSGFGDGLTINNGGTRLAIGHPESDLNGVNSGSVVIYDIVDDNFIQIGEEILGEDLINGAGRSISFNGDGNILAIGASGNNNDNGNDSGHVRVFNYDGINWNQMGQDIDGESVGDFSGEFVSISDDGTRVAIGAPGNNGNGTNSGHARVYDFNGENWIQVGSDIDGENAGDFSGVVDLIDDGNRLAIGAPSNDDADNNAGHVRVYDFINGNWILVGTDIDGEASTDASGAAISFSNDGNILFVGAPGNDAGNNEGFDSGHVRAYDTSNLLNVESFNSNTISIYPNPTNGVISFETTLTSLLDLKLYDVTGKMIKNYTNLSNIPTIDISFLKAGIYFLEIKSDDSSIIKRVIKF
ncbi:T9SS type A sorting domain-containing protein [uncultured Dokdonia sp.]|uniref:T9SS type A sorting domain-containing protein n=1 Tax=uncultured Dokdonia sp. TaxID=575653 RepID=UPI00262990C4|nr:T9SS type A sorting domain-containing protein [uncultured Dokdonia sp.]